MRFLKGLLGSWAGLTLATLIISAVNGSLGDATMQSLSVLAINNLIFAAVGATAIVFLEKPTWTWKQYAVTGALSSGLVLFVGFCVIAGAIQQATGASIGTMAFVISAVTCAIAGAFSGAGYRSISGNLTQ